MKTITNRSFQKTHSPVTSIAATDPLSYRGFVLVGNPGLEPGKTTDFESADCTNLSLGQLPFVGGSGQS
jgi:hypothetical protein